jgi:hypothetical protein
MKPRLHYDSYRRAYYLQWDVSDHVGRQEPVFERTREYICELADENANLRDALRALMVGTNAEMCADRDAPQCQECSTRSDNVRCAMTDAMELLGIDMYGEPMEVDG